MDPKERRSSWDPKAMLIGQSAFSRRGGSDLSSHERVNAGGGCGLHLGTRVSSSGVQLPLVQVWVRGTCCQGGGLGVSLSHS